MKIVIDKAIPFINGVFEPYAETLYKNGPDIVRDDLLDADALITRSRTRLRTKLAPFIRSIAAKRFMMPETSAAGRFQFSVEKA